MKILAITFALLFSMSALAESDSGSSSQSCSGTVRLCDQSGYCSNEYFYIYAYQYAYIYNGFVESESHSFSMAGFLGSESSYQLQQQVSGKHLIYTSSIGSLAIPYKNAADGIYYARGVAGPSGGWIKLCPR